MRVCIVGAGAIGAYLGAKMILAGEEVTLIARGAHLEAMQRNGLKLERMDGSSEVVQPALVTSDMSAAGTHDAVIVTVKAHSLPAVVEPMRALYGPDTMVITAQNGIPWWYFHRTGGPYEGRRIESVDPDGAIEHALEIERVIGCVVYPATTLPAPGVVRHIEQDRFTLGEPDGSKSERVQQLSRMFSNAGFKSPVTNRIRHEIWIKLWGNMVFNPISALTRATVIDIVQHPDVNKLARAMMAEGQAIGEKLGIDFGLSIEQRLKGAERVGAHKTSMLQDIESGRPTELDALLGAVIELGYLTETPTPHLESIYASAKLMEAQLARQRAESATQ